MTDVIADRLVNYTKSRLKGSALTYGYRKGHLSSYFRKRIQLIIEEVDNGLAGITFRRMEGPAKTDVIIGYGELPPEALAASVWNDQSWEIRLQGNYFSSSAFKHELGHILGLDHAPRGAKSLMQPDGGGFDDFTHGDWKALNSTWG